MRKVLAAAALGAASLVIACAACATEQPIRVRGEIVSVGSNTLRVETYDGHRADLVLGSKTRYAAVVASSLSTIKPNDFVGIGATGPDDGLQALEVVIFPESMRGTGEGHYAWSVPIAVANADRHLPAVPSGATIKGSMTNGTVVASASAKHPSQVKGTMTNGTVAGSAAKSTGEELTVSYANAKSVEIFVPATAPVVRFAPSRRAELRRGAKVFAIANKSAGGKMQAGFVAMGKNGLMPPM